MKFRSVAWAMMPFVLIISSTVSAARMSDIANTSHNLSASWGGAGTDNRTVMAQSETRICVFCHTPHAAENITGAPLWNRKLSSETYTMYDSSSMDATDPAAPSTSSKLCLSCHDGTLAIGAVNVLNGSETDQNPVTEDIPMSGTGTNGVMPAGGGVTTGDTRDLGINLTNDHPISITYDTALATADGELRNPATTAHIDVRSSGVKPAIPLVEDLGNNKVECVSCHDPHVRDDSGENIKFLRLNRFQTTADPSGTAFNESNDIICLGCHSKEGWVDSAHANELVANEVYTTAAAAIRGFPDALPVWRAACLNCHDTHAVQGSRRLLREGTDGTGSPKAGGNSAIEETCYQCHSSDGNTLDSQGFSSQVPDIKSDFISASHMPITNTDQGVANEVHDIGTANHETSGSLGKDFIESETLLGRGSGSFTSNGNNLGGGNYGNRHVECTDCHNPHRVVKERLANASLATPDVAGTHDHSAATHSNIISGVLRGAWGVEPTYSSNSFYNSDITYTVKRGVPGEGATMNKTDTYVTREYQICLKCHSNYAFDDTSSTSTPPLGVFGGSTSSGTNGVTYYTNQAREIQAPATHQGLTGSPSDSGAFAGVPPSEGYVVDFQTNNRRGWHPIMDSTGRAPTRGVDGTNVNSGTNGSIFVSPWNAAVGSQTMYCSDCHGSATTGATVVPVGGEDGNPWGPHGSSNDFILKGRFSTAVDGTGTGTGYSDDICFKCHDYNAYAAVDVYDPRNPVYISGFSGQGTWSKLYNMHLEHANRLNRMRCSWCHAAVPHGWKNKALLVNLNDVGPEATCLQDDADDNVHCTLGQPMAPGTQVRLGGLPSPGGSTDPYYWNKFGHGYNNPPYYVNAALKIINFKDSGNWGAQDCGSVGSPGTGEYSMCGTGLEDWATQSEGCNVLP